MASSGRRIGAATLVLLLLTAASLCPARADGKEDTSRSIKHHGNALIEWLRNDCLGFFNPKIEIRQVIGNDDENQKVYYGMFAKENVRDDEILMEIPRDCVLTARQGHVGDRIESYFTENDETYGGVITAVYPHPASKADATDDEDDGWRYDITLDDGDTFAKVDNNFFDFEFLPLQCATVRTLADETRLAQKSKFAPYVLYLEDTQPPGVLPSVWSTAGQELLSEVALGGPSEHMPPSFLLDWMSDDWLDVCQGDPEDMHVATLVVQRAWDENMIPVYDMINHRNGRWLNTDSDPIREGDRVTVRATRDIQAGEQLYISYNFCRDCQGRLENYGTPEVLRDYGFVEEYPRRFVLNSLDMGFDLDEVPSSGGDDDKAPPKLELTWIEGQEPDDYFRAADLCAREIRRLEDVREMALVERDTRIVSDYEWTVINQYWDALHTALQYALDAVTPDDDDTCSAGGEDDTDGTCSSNSGLVSAVDRYDSLEDLGEEWHDERAITCDYQGIYQIDSWDVAQNIKTHYQRMEFQVHNMFGKQDSCFDLEDTIQICQSYRPHYHEMIVHYTARFVEKVERVLFVGGGDSMLLHDILKYPSLEKVVGLELDQQVVRSSFRHFGTSPHFDIDKVEWWFGDATKSLLMLPKDYFGSFDMVLVDLSETVMALSVTNELDVMRALTLLLKPDGILVKNEIMYLMEMKEIFPYTVHLHYYGVPFVCSQSIILGSKSVVFPRVGVHDHKIDCLYRKLDDEYHGVMHDYQRNRTIEDTFCSSTKIEKTEQEASPGIMMVLEAEDASSKLLLSAEFEKSVRSRLEERGVPVVSTSILSDDKTGTARLFLLKDGYVISRTLLEHNYCGFDILLWSNFDKTNDIKAALVGAVGSKSTSSYRIVSGGMFGVSSWKDEEEKRGPESVRTECSNDTADRLLPSKGLVDKKVNDLVLHKFADLINPPNAATVLVLCGLKSQPCSSLSALEARKEFDLVPVWTCDDLTEGVEFAMDGPQRMFDCQKTLYKFFEHELAASEKKSKAIVLDSSLPFPMAQIVHKLFVASKRNTNRWLNKEALTIIASLSGKGSEWRRFFADSFRKDVVKDDPVFGSEVVLHNSESSLGFFVVSSGDENFFQTLDETLVQIEESTSLQAEIESVRGGELHFQDEFNPFDAFSVKDFDNRDATKQWQSQKPLGYQNVFQLEGKVQNCAQIVSAVKRVLPKLKVEDAMEEEIAISDGDGCLFTARWSVGHAVVLWDGREHVDINLYLQKEEETFARDFSSFFGVQLTMDVVLRDTQPRGPGRVVSFQKDLDEMQEPLWKSS